MNIIVYLQNYGFLIPFFKFRFESPAVKYQTYNRRVQRQNLIKFFLYIYRYFYGAFSLLLGSRVFSFYSNVTTCTVGQNLIFEPTLLHHYIEYLQWQCTTGCVLSFFFVFFFSWNQFDQVSYQVVEDTACYKWLTWILVEWS